jgi:hypothetical protein
MTKSSATRSENIKWQAVAATTSTGVSRLDWLLPRISKLTGSRAIKAGKCVKKWTVVGKLGRGLISAQPNSDRCKHDERQIVCREFVVSGRDTPTLLDLVEEPFEQIARAIQISRAIQIRAEATRTTEVSIICAAAS